VHAVADQVQLGRTGVVPGGRRHLTVLPRTRPV
jgi:hypothetical protein